LPSNPVNKFARWGANLSLLLPRSSGDLQGDISRRIARPTLVRVEHNNAQNALIFTSENALDDGPLVSPDLVFRAMQRMCAFGFLTLIPLFDGPDR
jgi:hypothetical protein